jgi:hypothetical protein
LTSFMRLSLTKAAHAARSNGARQEIRVRFGRDDNFAELGWSVFPRAVKRCLPFEVFPQTQLEDSVGDSGTKPIRAQSAVLKICPVLVLIVDRADGEAMEVNVKSSTRHEHKVAPMAVTEREVELAIADHEFPIRLPTADTPPVPRPKLVVIFVHVVDLVEAEKANFPFDAQMPAQVEIQKTSDADQLVRAIVGTVSRDKTSANQMSAAPAGGNDLSMKKSTHGKRKQAYKQIPFDHVHHAKDFRQKKRTEAG